MSLILDALTRADDEKRGTQAGPGERLTPALGTATGRNRPPVVVAAALLGALLLGAFVTLGIVSWMGDEPAPEPPSQQLSQQPSQQPSLQPSQQPSQQPESPSGPRTADPVAAVRRPGPAPDAGTVAAPRATGPVSMPQRPADPRVAALYARSPEDRGQPAIVDSGEDAGEPPVDINTVLREVREARSAAASDGLEPHEAPLLADLSQQFRNRVPTLMYLRHDYSSQGGSTVLINGQSLSVGQRSRGVEVLEILGDSVILAYEGTEFRLRALNSWVNL